MVNIPVNTIMMYFQSYTFAKTITAVERMIETTYGTTRDSPRVFRSIFCHQKNCPTEVNKANTTANHSWNLV